MAGRSAAGGLSRAHLGWVNIVGAGCQCGRRKERRKKGEEEEEEEGG